MGKMTVQQIAALKPKNKPYKVTADRGLMVRVATDGVKTWIVQYVVGGKQREYRLPNIWGEKTDAGRLSLADARRKAEEIRTLARDGIDYQVKAVQDRVANDKRIAEEQIAEEARRIEKLTLAHLFDAWIADGVCRKDGNAEIRRSFAKDALPAVGHLAVKSVTEQELREVLRKMVGRGVNRAAVVMRNNLTQMFAWGKKRQPWRKLLVDGNPMDLIEIEKIVSRDYDLNNKRERTLSFGEIRELRDIFKRMQAEYDAAPNKRIAAQPIEHTVQHAVWIMLATLCRVGELSMARWEHVDFEVSTWFIPKENVKGNLDDLTVSLSEFALDEFRRLQEMTGKSEWCFPAKNKEGHVCVKSMSKQIGDRQSMFKQSKDGTPRKPMQHRRRDNTLVLVGGKNGAWTPHDLRRTGATMMQSLGVSLDIIDRCQNHILHGSKVRRAYLHYDYAVEKREAWRLQGDRLSLIVNPVENVVPLQRTA